MPDPNQAPPPGARDPADRGIPPEHAPPPSPPESPGPPDREPGAEGTYEPPPAEHDASATGTSFEIPPPESPDIVRAARGLRTWLIAIAGLGAACVLAGQADVAMTALLAGLCVAAQAADFDARWLPIHLVLAWVVPFVGTGMFLALAFMLGAEGGGADTSALVGLCYGGAIASALTLFRPFANALAQVWFRVEATTHTMRLAARIVFIGLISAIPLWFATRRLFDTLEVDLSEMLDGAGLGLGLVGYVLLAFAAVGWLLGRDTPAALARLGIRPLTLRHAIVIVVGTAALFAMNGGADLVQRRWFHDLWLEDQRVNQAIVASLLPWEMLVLGLSAGIGEEITLRGALQPRLGLFWTSLLFAGLHVQYSWFGIGVILLIGIFLGIVRNRSNTTVAMGIHTLYDIVAVVSIPQST